MIHVHARTVVKEGAYVIVAYYMNVVTCEVANAVKQAMIRILGNVAHASNILFAVHIKSITSPALYYTVASVSLLRGGDRHRHC